jgi:hypothetical protein
VSSEQEQAIPLSPDSSATHPSPELPINDRYPRRISRKGAKCYLGMFKAIIKRYTECKLRKQVPVVAKESSALMLDTYNYIVDIERVVARVLPTLLLSHAWFNLVKRYGELGEYDPIPVEVERSVILAVCREWEYLGLHDKPRPSEVVSTECLGIRNDPPLPISKPVKPRSMHGKSKTPEYRVWSGMLDRCCNPNNKCYQHYGGRGIKVAPEFRDFETFLSEVGPRPPGDYTLDRIDNNGDYAPGNVRWILRGDQNANRRPAPEWPSKKRKAAARAARREALLAANISSQLSFDEKYLQAVEEREGEIALVDLIDWPV